MNTKQYFKTSWLSKPLAAFFGICLLAQAQAETVVSMNFNGNFTNGGSGDNPTYQVIAPSLWDGSPPTGANFVTEGSRNAIKLTLSEGLFFNNDSMTLATSTKILRVSMDFKVDNLVDVPGGHNIVQLFNIMDKWTPGGHSKAGVQVTFQRQANGKGVIKFYARDGQQGFDSTPIINTAMFANVDTDTWWHMKFVLDVERKVVTAMLNDRYFQKSFERFNTSGVDLTHVLVAAAADEGTAFRVGWGSLDKRDTEIYHDGSEGTKYTAGLYIDDFQLDNSLPDPSHLEFQDTLNRFTAHVDGTQALQGSELGQLYEHEFLPYMVLSQRGYYLEENKAEMDSYLSAYEEAYPPLFSSRSTQLPLHEYPIVDRVMTILQHDIMVTHYNSGEVADVASLVFEAREAFPGVVQNVENAVPISGALVKINGSYQEYAGIARNSPAHRPTGYWARAGQMVEVCLSDTTAAASLDVIVGAHPPLNLSRVTNRAYTIVTGFDFDETGCASIANPFGGGIYVRVPHGTREGWLDVTLTGGAVASPFFDNRSDSVRAPGKSKTGWWDWYRTFYASAVLPPWSDLESDNVMFTVPSNAARKVFDAANVMDKWDAVYDAVTLFQGRTAGPRPRSEYLVVDSTAYCGGCAGYWMTLPTWTAGQPVTSRMIGGNWDYRYGLGVFNITKDPNFSSARRFDHALHEKGHNLRHPTLKEANEEEAKANVIKLVSRTEVFGNNWEQALLYHNRQGMTLDEVVMDWLIMDEFLSGETMPLRAYQSRPMIKYIDLARLFGDDWSVVGSIMQEFYNDQDVFPHFRGHRVKDSDFAAMAVRAFENRGDLGVNPLPLLEFWGVIPKESTVIDAAGLNESSAIRAQLLEEYGNLVPDTQAAFFSTYSHLINHRKLVATRDRFREAHDNWGTAVINVGGTDYIGYPDAIQARIDQVISKYFTSP